MFNFYFFSLQH